MTTQNEPAVLTRLLALVVGVMVPKLPALAPAAAAAARSAEGRARDLVAAAQVKKAAERAVQEVGWGKAAVARAREMATMGPPAVMQLGCFTAASTHATLPCVRRFRD